MKRLGFLAGGGALTVLLSGCHLGTMQMTVPITPSPGSSTAEAMIVAWVLVVATGAAIISVEVRRRGNRPTSLVHALEVGIVASAGLALVGFAIVVALAGWIAISPPRAEPSLLQVSTTSPSTLTAGGIATYFGFSLGLTGPYFAAAVLLGRTGLPRWRRVRSIRGLLLTVLRIVAFLLALVLNTVFTIIWVFLPFLEGFAEPASLDVSAPGGRILLGLLNLNVLLATVVVFVRLLFREL